MITAKNCRKPITTIATCIPLVILIMTLCCACENAVKATTADKQGSSSPFDKEAHRGGRGLMPENTIAAMYNAIDLDITTLEMDVVISKDNKVVVSHDLYFSPNITTTPEGKYLTKEEAAKRIIYTMDYDSVRKYDVGMKPYPDFPRQRKMAAYKPLLSELIDSAEAYAASKGRTMMYNIETKSAAATDHTKHPEPATFVELLMAVIKEKKIEDRVIIQSFDNRTLQVLHERYPGVKTSLLIGYNDKRTFVEQLSDLGFTPFIYSPDFHLVTADLVQHCHDKGIRVLPWTVNDGNTILQLKKLGADGVITDYPDLFAEIGL